MKSIKAKILTSIFLLVGISMLVLGVVSAYLNVGSTNSTLEQIMLEMAAISASTVEAEMSSIKNMAKDIGTIERMSNPDISMDEKMEIVNQRVRDYDLARGDIVDLNGLSYDSGNDFSEREWFKAAIRGEAHVSEPVLSKVTGEMAMPVSAPIWEGGVSDTRVVGVIYIVPKENFLNNIVADINVSENGSAYILGSTGITIAHLNEELVKTQSNTIEEANSDPSLARIAEFERDMIAGGSGFGKYKYGGETKFIAYAPIADSGGWSVAVNAPTMDFMRDTIISVVITIAIVVIAIIIACIIAVGITKRISDPIKLCVDRIALVAKGDLKTPVPQVNSKDETGQLASATGTLVDGLNLMISDVDYLLGQMAEGRFDIRTRAEEVYIGDFAGILQSMRKINHRLSETLSNINTAADQVSSGSDQVSSGAQALSQGATEQASSIEELAATINDISEQIKITSDNAESASKKAEEVQNEAIESSKRMNRMLDAMGDISNCSSEIGKIIKTIEDIAFQTNILALNAAVEAARAGVAGKGFAVVADEVRNLASKSSVASRNTSELIENTLRSVDNGRKIADDTAKSLDAVVCGIIEMSETVGTISELSAQQASSASQVTIGIDQISSVVQTNSATAEESAASSEELSGQAQMLKELVGQFTLRKI